MIRIVCNEDFICTKIKDLLLQKNFYVSHQDPSFLFSCRIENHNSSLQIKVDNNSFTLKKPFTIQLFLKQLRAIFSDKFILFGNIKYFPFSQLIKQNQKKIILTEIHNSIFFELLTNKNGIHKLDLYKKIWQNDKNININKLDTHLTNLKNELKNSIEFQLNFISTKGILKINF